MYCPKCGAQNSDETKFCRGCGADVSSVPTALTAKRTDELALAEKQIDFYGSGLRGVVIGFGFLITACVAFAISIQVAVFGLLMLAFASYFLGTGIARILQSLALKRLLGQSEIQLSAPPTHALPDYTKPPQSFYETDDLAKLPSSVTEHTTTHLGGAKNDT